MAREDPHLKRLKRADKELGALTRGLDAEDRDQLRAVADRVEDLREDLDRIERLYLVSVRPRFSRHLRTALRLAGEPDPRPGSG